MELTSHFSVKIICKLYLKKQHYVAANLSTHLANKNSNDLPENQYLRSFSYVHLHWESHQRIVGKNINKDTFTSYLLNRYHKCPSGPWFDVHVMFQKASIAILSQNVTYDIFVLLIIS